MRLKETKINNSLDDSYYKVLDLEPGATVKEIEDAYRKIKNDFSVNAIASHSLFSQEEKQAIIAKAAEAYQALISRNNEHIEVTERNDDNQSLGKNDEKILFEAVRSTNKMKDNLKDNKINVKKPLVVDHDTKSLASEQYRFLCNRLEQASAKNNFNVYAITSAIKGEGKTTTAINMAYVLAHEFRKKVLLIDGDLRSPSLPDHFEFKHRCGIADILSGKVDPSSAFQSLYNSNLTFITSSASRIDNPSELLSSANMKRLMSSFKGQFDIVLIDCPPILPVVDMSILSEIVDGILFVVRADKTPKDVVLKALNSNLSCDIVGIILNGAVISTKKYSYYYEY